MLSDSELIPVSDSEEEHVPYTVKQCTMDSRLVLALEQHGATQCFLVFQKSLQFILTFFRALRARFLAEKRDFRQYSKFYCFPLF